MAQLTGYPYSGKANAKDQAEYDRDLFGFDDFVAYGFDLGTAAGLTQPILPGVAFIGGMKVGNGSTQPDDATLFDNETNQVYILRSTRNVAVYKLSDPTPGNSVLLWTIATSGGAIVNTVDKRNLRTVLTRKFEFQGGIDMTSDLSFPGNQTDRGIYWGSTGQQAYIRQLFTTEGQLEVGSDHEIHFNETDTDTTQIVMDLNSIYFNPNVDNTGSLGIATKKWSEVHATTYYGDGSNLTGITDAQTLQSKSLTSPSDYFDVIPLVDASGVMEIGRYIDFHRTDADAGDYHVRLDAQADNELSIVGIDNNGLKVNGTNTVWHSGNDGSGSGLDADLLDGVDSTQFARKDIAETMADDFTVVSSEALRVKHLITETGASPKWYRTVRIQNNNPVDSGESTVFSGTATIQGDFGVTNGSRQGVIHFAFGVRPDAIVQSLTSMGGIRFTGGSHPKFEIWQHSDGWHYLYFQAPRWNKRATFRYSLTQSNVEDWIVEDPTGVSGATKVWDSATDKVADASVGNNIIFHEGNIKVDPTPDVFLHMGA